MTTRKRDSGAKTHQKTTLGMLQSRWQQHRLTARQSLARLLAQPSASIMTIAVIGFALLLPSALFVGMDNLQRLSGDINTASQFSLYLHDEVTEQEAEQLSEQLLRRTDVAASDYISPRQAAADFEAHSGLGDVLAALEENPLPGAIILTPTSIDSDAARALLSELRTLQQVASAQLDLQWVERLQGFLQLAQRAVSGLMLILALAVLFVVGNTIRLAIESRRAEILVLKLVGGTNSYVARPFLYTGALYGLAGSVLAYLLLALIMLALRGPANSLLSLYESQYQLRGLGIGSGLLLVILGTSLGCLGAWISVKQHLAAIEPR